MKKMLKQAEEILEIGGRKRDAAFLIISGIMLICSIFDWLPVPFDTAWAAVILCGIPIILEAVIGLLTEFDVKADVLVSIALIASVCTGEIFAAGEVAFIMQLGGLLEELTVEKARAGIEKLVQLTPQTARVVRNNTETIMPAENVKVGDLLRVLPGETIPVDGVILSGQTAVNQAVMTGESLPVDKSVGDEVASGTVNQFGAFEMKAVKVGEDSSIQRMIRLVQSADAGKAEIVGIADQWATWIVAAALTAAVLTWLFTGEIIRAVTILVVFCPCALVLATPTAVMAAIGNAAKHGFLVKEGDALERLAKVQRIVFDKTGTLTLGKPEVIAAERWNSQMPEEEFYRYAAAAESLSEHPLGKAVVQYYRETYNQKLPAADQFCMMPGKGIKASADQKEVCAGNIPLLEENRISVPEELVKLSGKYLEQGATVIYLAVEGKTEGFLALADTLRPESKGMAGELAGMNVQPALLTGDTAQAAACIAGQLQISDFRAFCLPEDKLKQIENYQKNGQPVCMIGDGINDAPALKRADVGIALGGIGSDIAVDAADIALVDDQVGELPHLLNLSRRMMRTIKWNLTFSMTLNFAAVALAVTGKLNPVIGALVHNAGSVLVIINSALLLRKGIWKRQK